MCFRSHNRKHSPKIRYAQIIIKQCANGDSPQSNVHWQGIIPKWRAGMTRCEALLFLCEWISQPTTLPYIYIYIYLYVFSYSTFICLSCILFLVYIYIYLNWYMNIYMHIHLQNIYIYIFIYLNTNAVTYMYILMYVLCT